MGAKEIKAIKIYFDDGSDIVVQNIKDNQQLIYY